MLLKRRFHCPDEVLLNFVAHRPRAYPGFSSVKRTFKLVASLVSSEAMGAMGVNILAQGINKLPSLGFEPGTFWSVIQRSNH